MSNACEYPAGQTCGERGLNCCDCGDGGCGCACCWSCNACDACKNEREQENNAMTTTEQRLADALRNVQRMFDGFETLKETCSMTYADVKQALAAYDAQQAATRGAWRADVGGDGEIEIWAEGRESGEPIATVYDLGDARRIVQCVNAHDGLVAALQRCADRLGVLIECDNEDHGLAATADVDAYAGAVDALAAAGVSP